MQVVRPTEEVGRIAPEVGVKTLVLSHLVPNDTGISDEAWRSPAAKHFKGNIIVGHDLMVIPPGEMPGCSNAIEILAVGNPLPRTDPRRRKLPLVENGHFIDTHHLGETTA